MDVGLFVVKRAKGSPRSTPSSVTTRWSSKSSTPVGIRAPAIGQSHEPSPRFKNGSTPPPATLSSTSPATDPSHMTTSQQRPVSNAARKKVALGQPRIGHIHRSANTAVSIDGQPGRLDLSRNKKRRQGRGHVAGRSVERGLRNSFLITKSRRRESDTLT
jgi:hypothetical protein